MPFPAKPENIARRINELENSRGEWLKKLPTLKGVERKLAQTALTQIDARLRWYRGHYTPVNRRQGSEPYPARKRRWSENKARLAEVRS